MVSGISLRSGVLALRRVNACYIEIEVLCFFVDVLIIVIVVLDRDFLSILVEDLDVKTDGLELFDEDLEGFRNARLWDILALDDGLVRLNTADDIVGLDRQDLLQRVSGAQTSISPKRWPPNCALPPSGCCVTREYGPVERAWILSSTR